MNSNNGSVYTGMWPIPSGMRDLLPEEARQRRELENRLVDVFTGWGYQEVATPTLEFYDTLAVEMDAELDSQLYRFFDRDGRLLVLRPDMTTPIARLVATRLRHFSLPLRLFYIANVFRYESPQAGRLREFAQAGVELVGWGEAQADAEVIALAVKALSQAGLRDFQISVGQIQLFNAFMEELRIPEARVRAVKSAVARKDLVALEHLLQEDPILNSHKEEIREVFDLRGGIEVLAKARHLLKSSCFQQALSRLEEVYEHLVKLEVAEMVCLDLGLLRGFEYYTGIVFEGYTADLGFTICGGGRYDNLLGKFGYPCPATGFALGLDRLLLALSYQEERLKAKEGKEL